MNIERKKSGEKKHFGETDGSHSNKLYNYVEQNGRTVKQRKGKDEEADKAPIKGKDFIKYGYPSDTRPAKVIKNLQKEKDAQEQLDEAKINSVIKDIKQISI